MARRYEYEDWLEFLSGEDWDDFDQREAERLQKRYEDRIEELVDMGEEEGVIAEGDYPEDIQKVAYLSYATQAGHGVGLWEGGAPWYDDFERVINADPKLGKIFRAIESL